METVLTLVWIVSGTIQFHAFRPKYWMEYTEHPEPAACEALKEKRKEHPEAVLLFDGKNVECVERVIPESHGIELIEVQVQP